MKKLFQILFFYLCTFTPVLARAPEVNCIGLPGCPDNNIATPSDPNLSSTNQVGINFLSSVISNGIKYTAVIAVICLMLAGIKYMLSLGDDEKMHKAKNWIIYALAGVFLTVAAYSLIQIINHFRI